jgi:exosome complex exonuclease DIS3/RRP44
VEAYSKPILLIGRENMNRAVQGDIVAIEVFSEREWKAPTNEVVDQDCELVSYFTRITLTKLKATLKNDDADESDEEGERVYMDEKVLRTEVPSRSISEKQPTGRIVGIIKRNWRAYVDTSSPCYWL